MTNPNAINSTIYNSTAGADAQFNITNASNTAGADAMEIIQVAGGTGGDAYTQWAVSGVTNWVAGCDNSNFDAWVISASATPGTSDAVIISTAGATQFPLGNVTVTRAEVGGNVILRATNTDNTSISSYAILSAVTGGGAGGDPISQYQVTGGSVWSAGVDNSQSDRYSIAAGTDLGTNDVFYATTSGTITMPLGDVYVQRSAVGVPVLLEVNNTDNTNGSSAASIVVLSGGSSGGDPSLLFQIQGTGNQWIMGADNSSADQFTLAMSTALGTNNAMTMATTTLASTWVGDMTITRSDSGNTVLLAVTQSDGGSGTSNASVVITTANGGGDAALKWDITGGGSTWSMGSDNSASDSLVISQSFTIGTNNVLSIATSGAVTVPLGDLTVTRSNVGAFVSSAVTNTDNTNASSGAQFAAQVGGASAGDPQIQYVVSGATTWTEGVDNSASDAFVIAASSALGTTNVVSMSTAGATTFPTGNVSVTRSAASSDVTVTCNNTDNTSGTSNAYFFVLAGGASGGDSFYRYGNGVQAWAHGEDNSDADAWCLVAANTLTGTNIIRAGSGGNVTYPLTAAFMAYQASDQTNATGAGTAYTLGSTTDLTEVFDQSSAFNPATGTFTAPSGITTVGKFSLQAGVLVSACTIATTFSLSIITSNRTYTKTFIKAAGNQNESISLQVFADMDASDTATVTITVTGEAGDTCTISGSSTVTTFFSGFLQC